VVTADKTQNALYALHGVLIVARTLAYQAEKHKDAGAMLDRAEVLTKLLGSPADETATFRSILEKVAKAHHCNFVLERFDSARPWESV
jgi:hypothetical protein